MVTLAVGEAATNENAGRFYYGQLSNDGQRDGSGMLFDETAEKDDDEFKQCFEEGRAYTATAGELRFLEGRQVGLTTNSVLKHAHYMGQWKKNLPHGDGVQYYQGLGMYEGQFFKGKRNGRGYWQTEENDGKGNKAACWIYKPITKDGAQVGNWENDLMHGIAIVEDHEHVHENVIYTNGKCKMPFTEAGPPLTGFDSTVVVGDLIVKTREAKKALLETKVNREPPKSSIAKDKAERLQDHEHSKHGGGVFNLLGHGKKEGEEDAQLTGIHANEETKLTGALAGRVNKHRLDPDYVKPGEEEAGGLALVREPTDLALPEEDVLIIGGTGVNAVMNGLYTRISGTFGQLAFKLTTKNESNKVVRRFLYQTLVGQTKYWAISDTLFAIVQPAPGCAFVADGAPHPGSVSLSWAVWHPHSGKIQYHGAEEDKAETEKRAKNWKPIDQIVAKSVVGFEINGVKEKDTRKGGPAPGLMLRHASELYGRPVYEAENGGQYIYWFKDDEKPPGEPASIDEAIGYSPDGMATLDEAKSQELLGLEGAWIVAREVGDSKDGPACMAYIADPSGS
jgi:hypothetical protein